MTGPLPRRSQAGTDEDDTAAGASPVVQVQVLVSAFLPTPHGYVFRSPGSRPKQLWHALQFGPDAVLAPCVWYILQHPTEGTVLVDTGLHPHALENVTRDFGFPMRFLFRGIQPATDAFEEQLRSRGVEPADVRQVVMTHLHVDHTSGMRLLPNATFIVAEREWAATRGRLAAARGYVGAHLPDRSRMRLIDLEAGQAYGPFARTVDLFGDGRVRLVSTPGHTPGHLSVLVNGDDARPVMLAGDAAYSMDSIERRALPAITDDDASAAQTLAALRKYSHANPDAVVVPSHDPDAWRALRE